VGRWPSDYAPRPPVYFSNPDLVFANDFPTPRLGQGAFAAAVQAVYAQVRTAWQGARAGCHVGPACAGAQGAALHSRVAVAGAFLAGGCPCCPRRSSRRRYYGRYQWRPAARRRHLTQHLTQIAGVEPASQNVYLVAAAAAGGAQVAGRPLECVTSFGKPNAEPFRLAAASLAAQARRLAGGAAAPASRAPPAPFSAIYHGARHPSPALARCSAQPAASVLRLLSCDAYAVTSPTLPARSGAPVRAERCVFVAQCCNCCRHMCLAAHCSAAY